MPVSGMSFVSYLERRSENQPRLARIKLIHHWMLYGDECNLLGNQEEELMDIGLIEDDELRLPRKGYWTACEGGDWPAPIRHTNDEWTIQKREAELQEKLKAAHVERKIAIADRKVKFDAELQDEPPTVGEKLVSEWPRTGLSEEEFCLMKISERYPKIYINGTTMRYMCKVCNEWSKSADDFFAFTRAHRHTGPMKSLEEVYRQLQDEFF